jgi:hypothetical protein
MTTDPYSMLSEGIGRDLGIQYSQRSHQYSHVDSSKIFYISRDGISEREAIIGVERYEQLDKRYWG